MIGIEQLGFDPTDADSRDASHIVGARLLTDDGTSPISSGDGASDNVSSAFEAIDTRGFLFGYDSAGANWDRLLTTNGALHVDIQDAVIGVDILAEKLEDSAHASGDTGNYVLGVRLDDIAGANAALLAGTEGDYQSFFTSARGEMWVRDEDANASLALLVPDVDAIRIEQLAQGLTLDSIDTEIQSLSHAEDAAHVSGDAGIMGLGVRRDARSTLASADGDYTPHQYTANGDLRVRDDDLNSVFASGIDVNLNDGTGNDIGSQNGDLLVADIANGALLSTAKSVTSTSGLILASEQANRKWMYVQNLGANAAYIGAAGVTTANGIKMAKGSMAELRFGPGISLHAVTNAGTADLRILEVN